MWRRLRGHWRRPAASNVFSHDAALLTFDAQLVSSTACAIFIIRIIDELNRQNDTILLSSESKTRERCLKRRPFSIIEPQRLS